jgi:hypothetical protein
LTQRRKQHRSYYSWNDEQNPEQEKENQFVRYCIPKWWIYGFHHAYWHGKAPNDAQLENALAQNIM